MVTTSVRTRDVQRWTPLGRMTPVHRTPIGEHPLSMMILMTSSAQKLQPLLLVTNARQSSASSKENSIPATQMTSASLLNLLLLAMLMMHSSLEKTMSRKESMWSIRLWRLPKRQPLSTTVAQVLTAFPFYLPLFSKQWVPLWR